MSSVSDVRPGDIGFAMHVLPKSVDELIKWGQRLLGQPRYPHHVFVVTQGSRWDTLAEGQVYPKAVEAMPNGAREVDIDGLWGKDYVYLRPPYDMTMEPNQGLRVAAHARTYIGTPYSFADYAAIAGVRLGIKNGLVRRYVTSSKHQICSQLADQALCDAGFHVFNDKRLSQDVTPSALFEALKAMPGTLELRS